MEANEPKKEQNTEEMDVMKQFMELLGQQGMKEQSQDFMWWCPEADAEVWRKQAPIWMWLWSIRAGSMRMIYSMPLTRTVL